MTTLPAVPHTLVPRMQLVHSLLEGAVDAGDEYVAAACRRLIARGPKSGGGGTTTRRTGRWSGTSPRSWTASAVSGVGLPARKPRLPALTAEHRRALALLAACHEPCAEAIMLAHGFRVPLLVELVRAGYASTHPIRMNGWARADRGRRGKHAPGWRPELTRISVVRTSDEGEMR
jgi:hypothetical protein